MKNALITGIAIVIGCTIHALLTNPAGEIEKASVHNKNSEEYQVIARLKQSAVDQLSELRAQKMTLNGQDYLYMLLVDEKENGKGVNWTHKLFKLENDSLIKVPFE